MHLIKKCPECGRELRFPIDRGIIRITCICGHVFTADPDNPSLYNNARFDLTRPSPNRGLLSRGPFRLLSGKKQGEIKKDIINSLLKFKYDIQNFRLLPTREQRKLMLQLFVVAGLLLLAAFMFASLYGRSAFQNTRI